MFASSDFSYGFLDMQVDQNVTSAGYRISVRPTVQEVMDIMMDVFKQSNLSVNDVDEVVLTGGTSQFPLIREELTRIFGKEKISEHNIYQSVVNGLAQFALRQNA